MLLGQPIRQIAYYVNDVVEAATRHSALYGSGPFFIIDYPLLVVTHRGRQVSFNHTAAVGQWGAMQVELLQQKDNAPSILHDLFPAGSGKTGLHHVAMFVDNLEDAVAGFAKAGFPEVMRATPAGMDVTAVFVDTVAVYGHFVELYETKPVLAGLYEMVAAAAVRFDGRDPVRAIQL